MRLFLGDDYVKIDSGKWRSLDGTRQFRVKPDDYLGNHGIGQPTVPNTPHVHFEFLTPKSNGNGFDVIKNIHVPIKRLELENGIMIEMFRNNTMSFLLKVDTQGIEEMLKYIKTVSEKSEEYIQILYSGQKKKLTIKLDSDVDEMIIREDVVEMCMDEEELEYFEERLKNSQINKCFYPAEICERRYKNKCVTIYCDIIS